MLFPLLLLSLLALHSFAATLVPVVQNSNTGPQTGEFNVQIDAVRYFAVRSNQNMDVDLYYAASDISAVKVGTFLTIDPTSYCVDIGNSRLYFVAETVAGGNEIYKAEGATATLFDLTPTAGISSNPQFLTFANNECYFAATQPSVGTEFFKANATNAYLVEDINPGLTSSNPQFLTAQGTTVWFGALNASTGDELYRYNSTNGVALFADNSPDYQVSAMYFAAAQNVLYVNVNNGNRVLLTINTLNDATTFPSFGAVTSPNPSLFTEAAGASVYLYADTAANGFELYVSDGSTVTALPSITGDNKDARVSDVIALNSTNILFSADNTVDKDQPWTADSTTTTNVAIINSGGSSTPTGFTAAGTPATAVFSAREPVNGTELYITDGTSVKLVQDFNPGVYSSNPSYSYPDAGNNVYTFITTETGLSLAKVDASSMTSQNVTELFTTLESSIKRSSNVQDIVVTSFGVYWTAAVDDSYRQVFRAGNEDSVVQISNFTEPSNPSNLVEYNGKIYFAAETVADGRELWVANTTDCEMVVDYVPGAGSFSPREMFVFSSQLIISGSSAATGQELFAFNGTNITLVAEIESGGAGSKPTEFVPGMGGFFFLAENTTLGIELWYSNLSSTINVCNIGLSADDGKVQNVFATATRAYFQADSPATGRSELYIYNGTDCSIFGTVNPGNDVLPADFAEFNGWVYFSAESATYGRELFRANETDTELVMNINPGLASSNPTQLTVVGSKMYFVATNDSVGTELFSVSTSNSVSLHSDIYPGLVSSNPSNLVNTNNELYFSARTSSTGDELRKATTSGTSLVVNTNPGTASGYPSSATYWSTTCKSLVYTAGNGFAGRSLMFYKLCAAPSSTGGDDGDSNKTVTGDAAGDFALIGGIIGGVVVLGIGAFVFYKKRQ